MSSSSERKVMTPKFRVSFAQVFKPKSFQGQEPKYSVTMLFPKNTDMSPFKKVIKAAMTEKFGADEKKWPKSARNPIRDADGTDKEDLPGYKGHYFITASSKERPGLVDKDKNPILVEGDFYSGCYARATLIAFGYDTAGNKGVGFSLQNIQKLADGEAFSGRKKAEDEFDAVEDGSNDAGNYPSGAAGVDLGY